MTTFIPMKAVGIKQLKARLSEYVRLAKGGDTILVSDRDEVVAELGPPRRQMAQPDSLEAVLDRLADRGSILRASQPKKGWSWSPPALSLREEEVSGLLEDQRSDRDKRDAR